MSEKLLLIDGHSILNRAFYGLPDLTNSEGKHTGAVYGFLNILFRILEEEKPQYLTVAFDLHAPTGGNLFSVCQKWSDGSFVDLVGISNY